jgi:small-conductance mechanosensitive channel
VTLSVLIPLLVGLGLAAVGLVVRALLLSRLAALVRAGASDSVALLRRALAVPSILWCLVLGLWGGIEAATLPPRLAARLDLLLHVLIIISVTITASTLTAALVGRFGEQRTLGLGVTGLARATARGAVLVIGALVLLDHLSIAIAPILTALGVGGLAVALALQDTLSNLFAGLHLLADKPIRVGDFVKLENGVEGFVEDVGWRSTRVRTLSNAMVIVPNAKLAQSAITNYDLPESRIAVLIPVSVSYASDPDLVERVLVEEATRAASDIPGLLTEPPPSVRLIPGFGDSALQFTLVCQVASFVDQYLAQHEVRKRILRRLRAEGIEIPFPIRTIELRTLAASDEVDMASASNRRESQ